MILNPEKTAIHRRNSCYRPASMIIKNRKEENGILDWGCGDDLNHYLDILPALKRRGFPIGE